MIICVSIKQSLESRAAVAPSLRIAAVIPAVPPRGNGRGALPEWLDDLSGSESDVGHVLRLLVRHERWLVC